MGSEPIRVVRIDRPEMTDVPAPWTDQQRGQYLRRLLRLKGIDPDRFFRVAYYPLPRCWLVTQEAPPAPGGTAAPARSDEVFYRETIDQFRWPAHAACKALAAHSPHFARFGRKYELPPRPEEMTPADLASLLGGAPPAKGPPLAFNSEGGWRGEPSEN
jgi:hypothetical protein